MHLMIKIISLNNHEVKDKRLRKTLFVQIYIVNII